MCRTVGALLPSASEGCTCVVRHQLAVAGVADVVPKVPGPRLCRYGKCRGGKACLRTTDVCPWLVVCMCATRST
jgi:hypothetical protein